MEYYLSAQECHYHLNGRRRDACVADTRLRMAEEGVALENIARGLSAIAELKM